MCNIQITYVVRYVCRSLCLLATVCWRVYMLLVRPSVRLCVVVVLCVCVCLCRCVYVFDIVMLKCLQSSRTFFLFVHRKKCLLSVKLQRCAKEASSEVNEITALHKFPTEKKERLHLKQRR